MAALLLAVGWTYGVLYVEGSSMEPALSAGDVIIYQRARVSAGWDDLVVFEHRDSLVVHRVAGVLRDGSLRTKGDANRILDAEPVADGEVRGVVVLVVPFGKAALRLAALAD